MRAKIWTHHRGYTDQGRPHRRSTTHHSRGE